LGIRIAVGLLGGSPDTLLNKNTTASSEDTGVGASELQGEHNSVLLVDKLSEYEEVNIWRTLGSLECLVEVTSFCVKRDLSVVELVWKNL